MSRFVLLEKNCGLSFGLNFAGERFEETLEGKVGFLKNADFQVSRFFSSFDTKMLHDLNGVVLLT